VQDAAFGFVEPHQVPLCKVKSLSHQSTNLWNRDGWSDLGFAAGKSEDQGCNLGRLRLLLAVGSTLLVLTLSRGTRLLSSPAPLCLRFRGIPERSALDSAKLISKEAFTTENFNPSEIAHIVTLGHRNELCQVKHCDNTLLTSSLNSFSKSVLKSVMNTWLCW